MAAGAASRWSSGEESKPEIAFRLLPAALTATDAQDGFGG